MQIIKEIILAISSSSILVYFLAGLIIMMLIVYKRQHRGFSKEIDLIKSGFERDIFKAQLEIQEETFEHISLELHDNVAHVLSLAKLHLTTFKTPLPDKVMEKVDAAILLITQSLDEIRTISKSLNSENIKTNGLIKTVQQQIEELDKIGQFKVYFTITGRSCYLEELKEIVLFRIVQESFNNIVKHSKASLVHIRLHYDEGKLLLSIHDNGIGFIVENSLSQENRHTSGLKNILKRSFLINAIPEILSIPDKGTTINITTPY